MSSLSERFMCNVTCLWFSNRLYVKLQVQDEYLGVFLLHLILFCSAIIRCFGQSLVVVCSGHSAYGVVNITILL